MNPIWMLARGSGVAAYLLLAGATIWGLLLASKVLDRSASARDLTWVHESLSLAAVAATVVHMMSLWLEEFIDFDLRHLLIPGASSFRPVPVALGVVAFWALAVITPSFYLRNRIGQRAWRTLHFATFGCFLAAAIHGITAGTDTGQPVMVVLYATTLTAVLGLIVLRLIRAERSSPRKPAAKDPTPSPSKPRIPPELLEQPQAGANPDETESVVKGQDIDGPEEKAKPTPRIPPELLDRSRARSSADPTPEEPEPDSDGPEEKAKPTPRIPPELLDRSRARSGANR